ncbi:MAG TPA: DUF6284 family protein [Micromonosporaceae bacterium]
MDGTDWEGPQVGELDAIEREWPLIEAEMALVDAEIRVLTGEAGPSPLDWRRLRRAEQRVLREAARLADRAGVDRVAQVA